MDGPKYFSKEEESEEVDEGEEEESEQKRKTRRILTLMVMTRTSIFSSLLITFLSSFLEL